MGQPPKLQTCHNILRDAGPRPSPLSVEEWISTVFITNRAHLERSAKIKASYAAAPEPSSANSRDVSEGNEK